MNISDIISDFFSQYAGGPCRYGISYHLFRQPRNLFGSSMRYMGMSFKGQNCETVLGTRFQ